MGLSYRAVQWNRHKKVYDLCVLAGILLWLTAFAGISLAVHPDITAETLLIRGLGTAAFFLLHVVLSIGPLCRLWPRFLPLLYNRRHLGVMTFSLGLAHGLLSLFQFHAAGPLNPLASLFLSNRHYGSLSGFPFQTLGFAALLILFLMAATSHDFWLANLTAPVWKTLHMVVYLAYALLTAHVALGVLQSETGFLPAAALGVGLVWIVTIHLTAAFRETKQDRQELCQAVGSSSYQDACAADEIPDGRAKIVVAAGERVAIFRRGDNIWAVSNVCQHQNGPLGEGRIIDGCITCPWHGYQYLPESGRAPEPFTEAIPTFNLKIVQGRVFLDPRPNCPGTRVEPAVAPRSQG